MLRKVIFFFTIVGASAAAGVGRAADRVLAENGQSAYQIVLADRASPSTRHGAEELQKFIEEISGAHLPIVSDQQPPSSKEIILGDNAHLAGLGVAIDLAALGKEGYVIRTVGDHLVIAGDSLRGTMYGVYGFLEDHLGCRWFTPDVSRIPKQTRIVLGPIDDRQVPVLEFREPYLHECRNADWCARNRINSRNSELDATRGGKATYWQLAHSFESLVPVEKYFDEHPEYFSLVNGKRQREKPQLCCTNPDVVRICIESMREKMREFATTPTWPPTLFTVSPNDWDHHCECANCQALAKQEDSQMAPVLQLANQVAEALEKEFPHNTVSTLAYQWTRRPPKHMRPRPGVVVVLCSIQCCFSHSFTTCNTEANRAFVADVERWAEIAPRLWVWDYGTNFSHPLVPFPNLRAIGPNIRFYIDHNVKGIREQCCEGTPGIEFAELRGYVLAKSLWNPRYDARVAMTEFLDGYYGKAAKPILAYIDILHDKVERENIHLRVFSKQCTAPDLAYLSGELLTEADSLWQEAEELVAGQPEVLQRVKRSRMSVDYAIVERARLIVQKKLPMDSAFMQLALARIDPFLAVLQNSNVKYLKSWPAATPHNDTATYCTDLVKDLKKPAN